MDAFDVIVSLTEEAKSSEHAYAERSLGSAGVLSVEFNGGVPFYRIESPSSSYEPTMSQLLAVISEVL